MKLYINGKGSNKTMHIICPVCNANRMFPLIYARPEILSKPCERCNKYSIEFTEMPMSILMHQREMLPKINPKFARTGMFEFMTINNENKSAAIIAEFIKINNSIELINVASNDKSYAKVIVNNSEIIISNNVLNHEELQQAYDKYENLTIFS